MTTDDTYTDDRSRIARYAENHPDAGATEILAALAGDLEADLATARRLVEDVLGTGDRAGHGGADGDGGDGDTAGTERDFSDTPTARDADRASASHTSDAGDTVTDPNRNEGCAGVRHTSPSDHQGGETPEGGDPGDAPDADGEDRSDDSTRNPSAWRDSETDGGTDLEDDGQGQDHAPGPDESTARDAFADVVEWYHRQLDREIDDHTDAGDHPDRPTTAREYFTDVRGWDVDTLSDRRLGWAPGDRYADELIAWLYDRGHDRDAIISTGLFTDDLRPLWRGRYVLPYFDPDGRPVYAIARCTGDKGGGDRGYDGHPNDGFAGKYAKVRHTDDRVPLTEPIWGLDTLQAGKPVVVAEGIADAITATEAGYAALSPVAKEFKREHIPPLVAAVEDHDVPRVYVVPDAERARFTVPEDAPDDPATIGDHLTIPAAPAGLAGGLRTATLLAAHDVDALVADLPRPGLEKVDLDDYLHGWADDLDAVLASASPPEAFPEYEAAVRHMDRGRDRPGLGDYTGRREQADGDRATATQSATDETDDDDETGDDHTSVDPANPHTSSLWALDMADVTPPRFSEAGDRGRNPAAHTGDSENYFVLREGRTEGDLVASDYKGAGRKAKYNALTYLLVDAGERDRDDPDGSLSDREVWIAWRHARENDYLPLVRVDEGTIVTSKTAARIDRDGEVLPDPVPRRALWHIAREHDLADPAVIPDDYDDHLPPHVEAEALAATRTEYGIDPERNADRDDGSVDRYERVVTCDPPGEDLPTADVDAIREDLRTDGYDEFQTADAPTVWAHDPGAGKTTTAHLGAADRDRPLAFLFDKHRKAHEHRADAVTPDVDLHLRGADQPRDDACARAAYEGELCPDHGDPSNCPSMCPVYDLDPDHPDREAFQALAAELSPVRAHLILDPHDGDECSWLQVLQAAQGADTLAGVHEYQRLKTVREGDDGDRDVLIDESPGTLGDERRLDVEDLVRVANTLADWGGSGAAAETLRRFGRFARDVADAVVGGDPDLATLDPPAPVWDSYESHDPTAGGYVEYVTPDEGWQRTEALVRAKRAYIDYLLAAIRNDEWDGTPVCFDVLLAAAAGAGLDGTAARAAAGRQTILDHCPRCGGDLGHTDGRRVCDACDWDERTNLYTAGEGDPARILAWAEGDDDGAPDDAPGLVCRRLPSPSDLPDNPLVLDATATPEKIAAVYGVDQDDVTVRGDHQHALENARVTQILDGQYHHSTLRSAVDDDRTTARRIQDTLDAVGTRHDRPLVVGDRDVPELFDLPENAQFVHFHGARGLNFEACDAAVVVGAPHPNIEDLRRTAELLAQGRDDVRVGGEEHSTRDDCPTPPVYRKLRYTDDDGDGRAVATKHYTGLVGALFREAREKEIEQVVHRIRPLLADETKHAYLLTNVPTDLPVDDVCTLEDLADPAKALFPVADGAVDLAETLADVAAGDGPDGFRAGSLVETTAEGTVEFRIGEVHRLARVVGQDVSERTVRRWVDDLAEIGLVDAGEYDHRAGVRFSADGSTLTRAVSVLTSNASVEVAVKRRLAALATKADSAAEWLRAARDVADLGGDPSLPDRRRTEVVDPPDDPV